MRSLVSTAGADLCQNTHSRHIFHPYQIKSKHEDDNKVKNANCISPDRRKLSTDCAVCATSAYL